MKFLLIAFFLFVFNNHVFSQNTSFLLLKSENKSRKLPVKDMQYYRFSFDLKENEVDCGFKMIGGRIDRFTKDSIWLMPEYEELNTQNIKGIKIHSKKQFPKGTIPKVAFNKNEIIYLDLQSDKDIKWTEAGHVLTFLGSLTTLIIAPLVSIEYGNKGKFHSNRYYKWAAVGLGMVGVAIPIYVSSKKKKFDLTFYDNNVKRIWHFEN